MGALATTLSNSIRRNEFESDPDTDYGPEYCNTNCCDSSKRVTRVANVVICGSSTVIVATTIVMNKI